MQKRTKKPSQTVRQSRLLLSGAYAERLEERRLLAGNVTATINAGGDLIVNGDGEDNDISILIDDAGNVELLSDASTFVDDSGLDGKTVSRNVVVNMRGGNDQVVIADDVGDGDWTRIPVENIRVSAGSGDDTAIVTQLNITGDVRLNGGAGNDALDVKYSDILGSVTLSGGGGNDRGITEGLIVEEDLDIGLGTGNDEAFVLDTYVVEDLSISVGSGDNDVVVRDSGALGLKVNSTGGADSIEIENFEAKYESVNISTGGGVDEVTITGLTDVDQLKIGTGGGDDVVFVSDAEAEQTQLNTASGDDEARIAYSDFGEAQITMGSGDDALTIHSSTGYGTAKGNGGEDSFFWNWWSDIPDLERADFEFFAFLHDQNTGTT